MVTALPPRAKGHEMIRQFALKMADLWRYESGLPIDDLFGEWTGWEHFAKAQSGEARHPAGHAASRKLGIRRPTPSTPNAASNCRSSRLRGTGQRPHRVALGGRARVGTSKCSSLAKTSSLSPKSSAALKRARPSRCSRIVRRPPVRRPSNCLAVRSRRRSEAAELARASGCVLLPVYLPHTGHGYVPRTFCRAIPYDRRALRQPEERQKLVQQIIDISAPAIREHLDQWCIILSPCGTNTTEHKNFALTPNSLTLCDEYFE